MLRLFDRYYRKGDPKAMAVRLLSLFRSPSAPFAAALTTDLSSPQHCAKTLEDFNGGQSCIQIYVNQHDFFISKERVQETAGGLVGGAM
jgi:hypothetical protein